LQWHDIEMPITPLRVEQLAQAGAVAPLAIAFAPEKDAPAL
jgi:hypothetical protein